MRLFYFILISIFISGCSDVEFSETDEALKGRLDQNDIEINQGAEYTQVKPVSLSILGKEDQEMYITHDSNCESGGEWEEYKGEKNWELKDTNKNSFVYIKFRDKKGIESSCLYDDIIHDDIPPKVTFKSKPKFYNNLKNLEIVTLTSDATSGVDKVVCYVDNSDKSKPCKENEVISDLQEGLHEVTYFASDKAGNKSVPKQLKWTTDLTPPVVSFNKTPPSLSNLRDFEALYSAKDDLAGVAGFNCKFNDGKFKTCKEQTVFQNLASGTHKFSVMAIDEAGNFSQVIDYNWSVDLDKPTVKISKHPDKFTNETQSEFQFIGTDNGKSLNYFECQTQVSSIWEKCENSTWLRELNHGEKFFGVRTKDLAGNYSEPAKYIWTVDLNPPKVKLQKTPSYYSNSMNAEFVIQATDEDSGVKSYNCWFDNKLIVCEKENLWGQIKEGQHQFVAQAVDAVGNVSEKVSFTWVVDLTPPKVEFTKVPKEYISETSAEFEFKGTDDRTEVKKFECKLNKLQFENCSSPNKVDGLKEGLQQFIVRGYDEAGNVSSTVEHQWKVDLTPPEIKILQLPKDHLNTESSSIKFQINDKLSGVDYVYCGFKNQLVLCQNEMSQAFNLEPGKYEFEIQTQDKVGNKKSFSHSWEVFDKYQKITQEFNVNEQQFNIDILFVIDNSDSMDEEQKNMAQRISNFIEKIKDLNWQIGVTSTDPRTHAPDSSCDSAIDFGCTQVPLEHGDGGLTKFKNGQYVLNSELTVSEAQNYLGKAIQMGTGGSSSEEGIRATFRALEKSLDGRYVNHKKLIREKSAFAAVLISDEEESDNEFRNTPSNLINFVNSTWKNQKSFKYHSMINLPEFKCLNNDLGFGYEYAKLSRLTEGIIGSVCQDNYSKDLASIGQDVREQVTSFPLDCLPQDTNGDGKPEIEVEGFSNIGYNLKGSKITFTSPLPPGFHKIKYTCLRLVN
jgi:hypothetical protein